VAVASAGQVCTSHQTDNHASTSPLSSFTGRMPFLPPNQQRQSTEGQMRPNNCHRNQYFVNVNATITITLTVIIRTTSICKVHGQSPITSESEALVITRGQHRHVKRHVTQSVGLLQSSFLIQVVVPTTVLGRIQVLI